MILPVNGALIKEAFPVFSLTLQLQSTFLCIEQVTAPTSGSAWEQQRAQQGGKRPKSQKGLKCCDTEGVNFDPCDPTAPPPLRMM